MTKGLLGKQFDFDGIAVYILGKEFLALYRIANDATFVWTNGIAIGNTEKTSEGVESIGNPAGIGQGTGFGLRERDRDGIGLGLSRLRASIGYC